MMNFKTEYDILLESLEVKQLSSKESDEILKSIYHGYDEFKLKNKRALIESELELKNIILISSSHYL